MSQPDYGRIIIMFVAFLFSICFHEFAHAWVAYKRGDNTAKLMGRLTLNPVAHADILGTIVLPLMGMFGFAVFGWAKPVPVNPSNLRDQKNDMFWVAAAGPGSNLLLAFLGTIGLVIAYQTQFTVEVAYVFLRSFIFINLILCFFNLIPLHPLDGGKIIGRFLPEAANRKLEEIQPYSMMVLLFVLLAGGGSVLMYPVQWTMRLMLGIVEVFIP